jgi:S-adenosylmethionine:tRNA ribosyltransferase-isomerase
MRTNELDYDLPEELIAQQPAEKRCESRLLVLDRRSGQIFDRRFENIGEFLRPGDCLVLNDTKVLAARFFARRSTGGKLEGLFLQQDKDLWEVMLKGLGKVRARERIWLKDAKGEDFCRAEVIEKKNDGKCVLKIEAERKAEEILEEIGFAPVPPYIKRDEDLCQAVKDKERYQTVYAKNLGAVAAPTAGLHFTKELIRRLESEGVLFAYITLHVGEGTFRPVTAERIEGHKIHPEWFSIDEKTADAINRTKQAGGRIVPVGTTSVRTIEAAAKDSTVAATSGQTELFILPGYRFKMVDAMVTNFHLPRSTLLALVAAFAGLDTIRTAYKHAIEKHYRFYSYGDAMLII